MNAGIAGALALVGADLSRYARTPLDVRILAVEGAIVVNLLIVGILVFQVGNVVYVGLRSTVLTEQWGTSTIAGPTALQEEE